MLLSGVCLVSPSPGLPPAHSCYWSQPAASILPKCRLFCTHPRSTGRAHASVTQCGFPAVSNLIPHICGRKHSHNAPPSALHVSACSSGFRPPAPAACSPASWPDPQALSAGQVRPQSPSVQPLLHPLAQALPLNPQTSLGRWQSKQQNDLLVSRGATLPWGQ